MKSFKQFINEELLPNKNLARHYLQSVKLKIRDLYLKNEKIRENNRPSSLTPEQSDAIKDFSGSSSEIANHYLRLRNTSNDSRASLSGIGDHELEKVKSKRKSIETLLHHMSEIFKNKDNLNKRDLHLYSGIHPEMGHRLMKLKNGSSGEFETFTSTSLHPNVAKEFATDKANESGSDECHILHIKSSKGTALSVDKDHSYAPEEQEFILHHGQGFKYHGTTIHEDEDGNTVHVHHVTIEPDRKTDVLKHDL